MAEPDIEFAATREAAFPTSRRSRSPPFFIPGRPGLTPHTNGPAPGGKFFETESARMNSRLFESFCEMIENIPVKAVLKAAEAERRMVEDDLAKKRIRPSEETRSVLSFCEFLVAAAQGDNACFPVLPIEHCAFYRKIVGKLVDAGELPFTVKEHVDHTFSAVLYRTLTSAI